MADKTLLLAGFFKEGEAKIIPANLNSLNYCEYTIASKDPSL